MYYILYSYNKANERKENAIEKIISKRKYICSFVCIYWKNLHVSGHMQFKPVLFKGQLYFLSLCINLNGSSK